MANELVAYEGGNTQDNPEQSERRAEWQKIQDAAEPIIRELEELAAEQIQMRKPIEKRWLEDLRQFHGHYEKETTLELQGDNSRSQTFINITRSKTNSWAARLGDMLLPNDEKNWGINPTPVPQLTREARDLAAQADKADEAAEEGVEQHNEDVAAGAIPEGQPSPALTGALQAADIAGEYRARAKAAQSEIEVAKKTCSAMERLIDDQLTESKFPAKCRDAIADECKLGVGIIKGPIVNSRPRRKWKVQPDGQAEMMEEDTSAPTYRRVDPWHFFPDMSAATIEETGFTLERYLPNKKMLRKMAREMGFNKDAVRKLLEPDGAGSIDMVGDLAYLSELRSMELSTTDSDGTLGPMKDRYVVWEYRGTLESKQIAAMIRASGRMDDANRFEEDADELQEHMVTVWFCNGQLLKIDEDYILDSGEPIYSVASFEKAEASILGAVGVPRLMRHEQIMLNSAVRMVMDNAALSVAPQVVIDPNGVEPQDGSWKLTARKLWRRVKGATTGTGPEYKPFEIFTIPLNQAQLAAIVEMALRFVDEAVSMPTIAEGEQGAHVTQTASGMSMLMNSANVVFRRVVKNYDDDMIGLISRTYDFNMQFSDDLSVKGDMKTEARGTSVLLVREIQSQQLQTLLAQWSTHPIMGVGLRAYNLMRMVLQAMSINPEDALISEEDYMAKLAEMAAPPEDQAESPESIRAQTALEVANIDATSRAAQGQVDLQIADIRKQTEFAKLAENRNISLASIEAMFKSKQLDASVKIEGQRIKTGSDERKLAAEIGIERENAREAREQGMNPTGSGGAVSMGGTPV